MGNKPTELSEALNDIEVQVGGRFKLSIAQRAHACAVLTLESDNEKATLHMLEEGWNRRLSRDFSAAKASVRQIIERTDLDSLAEGEVAQLKFPVIAPGFPAVPLARATHELLNWAHRSEVRQLKGRQKNVALLAHYAELTRPFPNVPVATLLKDGRLSREQLTPDAKQEAA